MINGTCLGFISSRVTKTDAALHENDTIASVGLPVTVLSQRMQFKVNHLLGPLIRNFQNFIPAYSGGTMPFFAYHLLSSGHFLRNSD